MGYILPVTPYSYKQYQNRMKETEESPYYIDSVYRTVFHRISTEYEEENEAFDDLPHELEEEQEVKKRGFLLTNWQKTELTGKGGTINEKV